MDFVIGALTAFVLVFTFPAYVLDKTLDAARARDERIAKESMEKRQSEWKATHPIQQQEQN